MFYLMAEIDGVLARIGRRTRDESTSISNALRLFHEGWREQSVSYVEVWERHATGSTLAWSTQLARL